jgi:hypothetical protein
MRVNASVGLVIDLLDAYSSFTLFFMRTASAIALNLSVVGMISS